MSTSQAESYSAVAPAPLGCPLRAQFKDAVVGGVVRLPRAGRVCRLPGLRWGGEIRLADAERDDIFHAGGDIEELADARRAG